MRGSSPRRRSQERWNEICWIDAPLRREYSEEFKAEVLAQTRQADALVSGVALNHGLHPNMVQRWRRDERQRQAAPAHQNIEPAFVSLRQSASEHRLLASYTSPIVSEVLITFGILSISGFPVWRRRGGRSSMAHQLSAPILKMPQFAHYADNVWNIYEPSPALGFTLLHPLPLPPLYQQRAEAARVSHWLQAHGVQSQWLDVAPHATGWRYHLTKAAWEALTPEFDTVELVSRLGETNSTRELEVAVALLASPVELVFPSFDELSAQINARINTCTAGEKTTLAFATETAERPASHWTYQEDTGFTVLPGLPLIEALTLATQPATSGELYSFSCYRATEYVMLLGLAQTCKDFNPQLLEQLQAQWESSAIASGRFHDTFLTELGSLEHPIPARYYVPGDRVWFRNPDELSSDAVGFEGSWVVYLGQGRFTDFWRSHSHYTFEGKCLEIYYWREAVVPAANDANVGIDEQIVWKKMEALMAGVASGLTDALTERDRILGVMTRYRDGRGVYANGGCVDATREHLGWLCPAHCQIQMPMSVSHRDLPDTTSRGIRPASTPAA